jgi:hypothetical protein
MGGELTSCCECWLDTDLGLQAAIARYYSSRFLLVYLALRPYYDVLADSVA